MFKLRQPEKCLDVVAPVLMEKRNGLVVDAMATSATGTSEREAAIATVADLTADGLVTLGGMV